VPEVFEIVAVVEEELRSERLERLPRTELGRPRKTVAFAAAESLWLETAFGSLYLHTELEFELGRSL
jgi:hypothetical protein